MKIFDGVELKQTPGSGIQNWLSVAMLIASSFLEADKCRQERLAGGPGGPAPSPNTLEEVMAQVGLKIPALEEALGQLMGGSDEAKQAAAMIARAPEPGNCFSSSPSSSGSPAPRTPGPSSRRRPPLVQRSRSRRASGPSSPARRDRRREPRRPTLASRRASGPSSPARRARRRAAATVSPAATAGSGPVETSRPSLVSLVEGQLAALRQRMKAHEEVIDARLKRAESELAAMRQGLEPRSRPTPAVVPAEEGDTVKHTTPEPEVAAADRPNQDVASDAVERKADLPLEISVESAPVVTEEQVAEAVGLISAFAQQVEERHQQQLAHVDAVEHEVQVLRSKIAAQPVASNG
ncbi:hypothetical protein [Nannocystis pusilla]|uniref:hypothetical protein n=1 Tax=Nannocystis pusilla TaxID=889268 RepID=UPI003B7B0041